MHLVVILLAVALAVTFQLLITAVFFLRQTLKTNAILRWDKEMAVNYHQQSEATKSPLLKATAELMGMLERRCAIGVVPNTVLDEARGILAKANLTSAAGHHLRNVQAQLTAARLAHAPEVLIAEFENGFNVRLGRITGGPFAVGYEGPIAEIVTYLQGSGVRVRQETSMRVKSCMGDAVAVTRVFAVLS